MEGYLSKSKGCRNLLRRHLDALADKGRTATTKGLQEIHVRRDVTDAASPEDRLKAWLFLCSYGLATGLLAAAPSQGVKARPRVARGRHAPWTAEEVAAFRARWPVGTSGRAAMELLFWTGARIGDAVRIGPGMVDREGVLTYRQRKAGDLAHVPWTCPCQAMPRRWKATGT